MRRLTGPKDTAFRETISRRPRPRVFWFTAYGTWVALLFTGAFGLLLVLIFLSGLVKQLVPKPLAGPVTISLLLIQQAPLWINLIAFLRTRKHVRQASGLACPNCLFNLSDLTDLNRCPECGFDTRSLDIPAAWKSLFQWSLARRAQGEEGY